MTPAQFKAARKSIRLNQQQLAEAWGKSERTIRNWETGDTPLDQLAVCCITLMMEKANENP